MGNDKELDFIKWQTLFNFIRFLRLQDQITDAMEQEMIDALMVFKPDMEEDE